MNNTGKKIVSSLIICGAIAFFDIEISKGQFGDEVPVKDAEVIEILEKIREKELGNFSNPKSDKYQRKIANERLLEASRYIVNLVKCLGRKGQEESGNLGECTRNPEQGSRISPDMFVKNWRNFTLEGQYRGEDVWRGLLTIAGYGVPEKNISPLLCKHIRESAAFNSLLPKKADELANKLTASGPNRVNRRVSSLQEYLVTTKCDSVVDENFDKFMENFSEGGGWDTFEKLLQPQNNIYGAIGLALGELNSQRGVEEQADISEAISGSGYLGRRSCLAKGAGGQCVLWNNIQAPANVAAEALGAVINQNLAWITNSDEVDELLDIYIFEVVNAIFGTGEIRGRR